MQQEFQILFKEKYNSSSVVANIIRIQRTLQAIYIFHVCVWH